MVPHPPCDGRPVLNSMSTRHLTGPSELRCGLGLLVHLVQTGSAGLCFQRMRCAIMIPSFAPELKSSSPDDGPAALPGQGGTRDMGVPGQVASIVLAGAVFAVPIWCANSASSPHPYASSVAFRIRVAGIPEYWQCPRDTTRDEHHAW